MIEEKMLNPAVVDVLFCMVPLDVDEKEYGVRIKLIQEGSTVILTGDQAQKLADNINRKMKELFRSSVQ